MTKEEQKAYILRQFPVSNGVRIAEALKRYWTTPEVKISAPDSFELSKEIFNEK